MARSEPARFGHLRADLGHEWNAIQEMIAAAAAIEAATDEGIDIQPFRRFAAEPGHLEPEFQGTRNSKAIPRDNNSKGQ